MSAHINDHRRRPLWFTPLASVWLGTGLPAALVVPYFSITGTSPTGTPPPITGLGEWVAEAFIWLLACVYIFGSPMFLAYTEFRYRRRMRTFEQANTNAAD
jgi:hypothetical protein